MRLDFPYKEMFVEIDGYVWLLRPSKDPDQRVWAEAGEPGKKIKIRFRKNLDEGNRKQLAQGLRSLNQCL